MNSSELISLGIANARELFDQTGKPEWNRLAGDYSRLLVNKNRLSPKDVGSAIGILLSKEIELTVKGK